MTARIDQDFINSLSASQRDALLGMVRVATTVPVQPPAPSIPAPTPTPKHKDTRFPRMRTGALAKVVALAVVPRAPQVARALQALLVVVKVVVLAMYLLHRNWGDSLLERDSMSS